MNKIKIVNDEIKIINLNNSIEYEIKDNLIKTLKIEGNLAKEKNDSEQLITELGIKYQENVLKFQVF